MDVLSGIPDLQVDFEKVSNYFAAARKAQVAEPKEGSSKKADKSKTTVTNTTQDAVPRKGPCICSFRKTYFSQEKIAAYKRILQQNASEDDPENLVDMEKFQELHVQLVAAQQQAIADLSVCVPCGHLVLPIDLEEAYMDFIYRDQEARAPSETYKRASAGSFVLGRYASSKLVFLRAFGEDSKLGKLELKEKKIPRVGLKEVRKVAIGSKHAAISTEANIIASADVLTCMARYLNSTTKCFFPVEVVTSPSNKDKRVVLLRRPYFQEPPKDNRLRAAECYRALALQAFFNFAHKSDDTDPLPEEPELCIDLPTDADVAEGNKNSADTGSVLNEVLTRCQVVQGTDLPEKMEVLSGPASPEYSSGSTPEGLSPRTSPVVIHATPPGTPRRTPGDDGRWNLFKLGAANLLVASEGLQLTPDSCSFGDDCPFWPNCSKLWTDQSGPLLNSKIVHLDLRPEYLQPWGCEELSEEEIFSTYLGSKFASPFRPTVLRLRVEASTGKLIFAEVQKIDQLLESYSNFKVETHLASLANVISGLLRLPVGKYLLSSQGVQKKPKYELYELTKGTDSTSSQCLLDLRRTATEYYRAACQTLTSLSQPVSEFGATWRCVKRLPLDPSIPSRFDGQSLLIPAIDTGLFEAEVTPQVASQKSPGKRPPPVPSGPQNAKKHLKVERQDQ